MHLLASLKFHCTMLVSFSWYSARDVPAPELDNTGSIPEKFRQPHWQISFDLYPYRLLPTSWFYDSMTFPMYKCAHFQTLELSLMSRLLHTDWARKLWKICNAIKSKSTPWTYMWITEFKEVIQNLRGVIQASKIKDGPEASILFGDGAKEQYHHSLTRPEFHLP